MNLKKYIVSIFILFLAYCVQGQSLIPRSSNASIIKKTYYTLCYNENNRQADWVYYELTYPMINGIAKRKNNFRVDKSIKNGASTPKDYLRSGYDRGHLCPAAAMKQNSLAMSETFYMSNMSPQKPYFNRGVWKKLEAKVRSWVHKGSSLYVVTGPIFKDNLGSIGKNKVTIPGYFYKVIYDPLHKRMIAFVLRNKKSELSLKYFVTTVDKIEKLTNIDFFPELDDKLENKLESKVSLLGWKL